ncbi:MAG: trypsin-like peptidase domain-containing protein [Chloroflexota bacterium]|nr:trypsin-like peptidase domain-containing protein [Chloroflexota bacterium]
MIGRVARAVLASVLLVLLLVLGGLSVSGIASNLRMAGQSAPAGDAPAAQVKPASNQSTAPAQTDNAVLAPEPQVPVQGGVLDARAAARKAGPAVVTVVNYLDVNSQQGAFGAVPQASGSGVIIDSRGYIVTNNHVVENQRSLEVIFSDGEKAPATLVGTDPFSDLAVLKVDTTVPAVASWGDSDSLEPGQPVVAIGSALGDYQNSVTAGVVSQVHRDIKDADSTALRDLIQTDAAINHGNSGGPLLDIEGNVIGINVAVVRNSGLTGDIAEGLGFAIPSNTAKQVADQIINNGTVSRPFIGITYQMINERLAGQENLPRDYGVLISQVSAGSPAEKAGITPGSIITRFEGVELNEDNTLMELLMQHKVGDTVTLTILEEGASDEKDVQVTLASRPKDS